MLGFIGLLDESVIPLPHQNEFALYWNDSRRLVTAEASIQAVMEAVLLQTQDYGQCGGPSKKIRLIVGPAHTRTSSVVLAPSANKEPVARVECGRDGAQSSPLNLCV